MKVDKVEVNRSTKTSMHFPDREVLELVCHVENNYGYYNRIDSVLIVYKDGTVVRYNGEDKV